MLQSSGCSSETHNSHGPEDKTLYLPSMTDEIQENQIFDYFSAYGEVHSVQIRNNREDAVSSVTFKQVESAIKARANEYHNGIAVTERKPLEFRTETTGTNLLDLNDDCLYEILSLESISIMDLWSIARTSSRLQDIANVMFTKRFTQCNLKSLVSTIPDARRLIITFGSLISALRISSHLGPERRTGIFDLVTERSSNCLKSLCLYNYDLPERVTVKSKPLFSNLQKLSVAQGNIEGEDLFGNCESLLELNVTEHNIGFVSANTFPNLKIFTYDSRVDSSLGDFISRHKNLKSLIIRSYDDLSFLLPVIGANCKQLEELKVGSVTGDSVRYENAFRSIVSLEHLEKLFINCNKRYFRKIDELGALKSLKSLEFRGVKVDSKFLPNLSKLKTLQVFRLTTEINKHLLNLNILRELVQIKELSIKLEVAFGFRYEKVDLDVDHLIESLTKLISLKLFIRTFNLNKKKFLNILEILRTRVASPEQTLEVTCNATQNITEDLLYDNRNIIKLTKITW